MGCSHDERPMVNTWKFLKNGPMFKDIFVENGTLFNFRGQFTNMMVGGGALIY